MRKQTWWTCSKRKIIIANVYIPFPPRNQARRQKEKNYVARVELRFSATASITDTASPLAVRSFVSFQVGERPGKFTCFIIS